MTTVETPPALLSVAEAASRLHVSRVTAYRLVSSGKLPALRIGNQIRIDADELERYVYGRPAQ
jgi:excisionase family DNA binding protein